MARLPRYFVEGQPQHIIQRGNNRELIFAHDQDYLFYLECLKQALERYELIVRAYVLMTNHVHVLATPAVESSIPKTLQSVGRRYVQYLNYYYERTGTLWEGRYRATIVDSERYLLTCMRYIELNPVRAGMVKHPRDYRWSSYRHNGCGEPDDLIDAHEVYRGLGRSWPSRQSGYRQLFRAQISQEDLRRIRDSTNKAWVLGSQCCHGLLVRPLPNDAIGICPPLIITEPQVDELFDCMERSLDDVAAELKV